MGIFVLRNAKVGIDGVDLSAHVREVEVALSAAEVDITAMGNGGMQRLAGIRDDGFTINFYSDFAASKVHATINPKFVAAGTVEVKVTANNGTVGEGNPMFVGYCPVLTYSPIAGAVGDASMTSISLPANGTVTAATAGTVP